MNSASDNRNSLPGRPRRRGGVLLAGGLALGLILAGLVVVKYWIGPARIRSLVQQQVERRWQGKAVVEDVEFNYLCPTRLGGLCLYDRTGRPWVRVGSLEISVNDWLPLTARLDGVLAHDVQVHAHLTDGRLVWPLCGCPANGSVANWPRIVVENLSVSLSRARLQLPWQHLSFQFVPGPDRCELSLCEAAGQAGSFSLQGWINHEDGRFDAAVEIHTPALRIEPEAAEGSAWAGLWAGGAIDANLRFRRDADSEAIQISGHAGLANWRVSSPAGDVATDLAAGLTFTDGDRQTLCADPIEGNAFGGRFRCTARAEVAADNLGQVAYTGRLAADGLELRQLTAFLGSPREGLGLAKCDIAFGGASWDVQGLRASGTAAVAKSRLGGVDLLGHLLAALSIKTEDPGASASARFSSCGPVVTLQQVRMSGDLWSLEVQSGGTIDLGRKYLDLYMVGAPVKPVKDILRQVPLVCLFTNFADHLTRVHVRGPWNAPPGELFHKEPARDVQDGTLQFFRSVVSGGASGLDFWGAVGNQAKGNPQ